MGKQEPVYSKALEVIVCALNLPLGSAVEVAKAVYGPDELPIKTARNLDRKLTAPEISAFRAVGGWQW